MADGVKITKDASGRRTAVMTGALLCLGAVVGILAAMWLFDGGTLEGERRSRVDLGEAAGSTTVEPTHAGEHAAPVERIVTRARRASASSGATPPAPADTAADPEPEIRAGEYIEALRAAGETGGIAAFNPPGTDPVRSGIIVPDDYELPPGYARRHQTLDDGTDVPPILAFSPGYEFLDENGKVIPLPDDLIVPPEMAPPDLPVRILNPKKYAGR
jgi:hypothetical protein